MKTVNLFLIIMVLFTVFTRYVRSGALICYFNAEARYRNNNARFDTYNIDFSLCTHYIYAYAKILGSESTIMPLYPSVEPQHDGVYMNFTGNENCRSTRNVTLLISIGGPNATEHESLVEITQSETKMRAFSSNVLNYLWYFLFDGLDIDWQYPTTEAMKRGFVKLLEIMRETFDANRFGRNYLITVKCPAVYSRAAYDAVSISKFVDYVSLATYDFRPLTSSNTCFGSPFYTRSLSNVKGLVSAWLRAGLVPEKTVVGISPVCRFQPGSSIRDDTLPNYYNISNGLAYSEICKIIDISRKKWDCQYGMSYLLYKNNKIYFETDSTIITKMFWIRRNHLAGVMFSSIDIEGLTETCNGGPFRLLKMIKRRDSVGRKLATTLNKAYTQKYSNFFIIIILLSHLHI